MAPAPDPWVRDEQRTIGDLLDRRLDSDPDGPFLEVCGTRWTAAEVDAATNRVAHGLTRLGVQPGDRVASLLENSPEALLTWWGAIKAGAVAVPVNTAHKGVILEHQISDAAPRVLVVQDDLSERVDAGITGIDGLDHVVTVSERARRSGDAT